MIRIRRNASLTAAGVQEVLITDTDDMVAIGDGTGDSCMDAVNNALRVNIVAGAGSGGTAIADDAAFTVATTSITPVGGIYRSIEDSVDDGDAGAFAMTADRRLKVNLADALPAGTNNIGDVDVASLPGTVAADIAAIKTATELIDNAISGAEMQVDVLTMPTVAVTGTFYQATQPVSAASLPLPTGAATEATLGDIKTAAQLIDDAVATTAAATPAKGLAVSGNDGTNARILKTDTNGELQVDVLTLPNVTVGAALPAGTNAIGKLSANSGIDIGDVDVTSVTCAAANAKVDVGLINGVAPLMGNGVTGTGSPRITIASDSSALAVKNQDGSGNSLSSTTSALWVHVKANDVGGSGGTSMTDDAAFTVATTGFTPVGGVFATDNVDAGDGGAFAMTQARALHVYIKGTDVGASGGTSMTDDAAFTVATTSITPVGGVYQATPDSVDDGDGGAFRMTADRKLMASVADALPAGTNNIGDVDILSIAAGDNNIGNVDIVSGTLTAVTSITNNVNVNLQDGAGTDLNATTNALWVHVKASDVASGGTSMTDDAAFTPAVSTVTPMGAMFDDTATDSVDEGDCGVVRMTADRILLTQVSTALPAGTNAIGKLAANSGVDIGDVDVLTLPAITIAGAQTLATVTTVGAVTSITNALPAGTNNIGDVDVLSIAAGDNNIGNVDIVTLPGTVETDISAVKTAVQLIDDCVFSDDAAFTPATSKVLAIGAEADEAATDSVDEGDIGALRMTTDRQLYVKVGTALPAGTNAIGKLAANSGVDIGDVDVTSVTCAAANAKMDIGLINAVTPLMGNGVTGTGSLRVTIASDNTANSNPWLVSGGVAHDGVDSGNPVKVGAQARSTMPASVADADRTNLISDLKGRVINTPFAPRELSAVQQTTITSSTSETTIVTAIASTFCDLAQLTITNSSSTALYVTLKDSTAGTTRGIYAIAANGGISMTFSTPLAQAAVNNNWTLTCSGSVASVYVVAQYVKNT